MNSLGKIVEVDLGAGAVTQYHPEEEVVRKFLGGRGLNAYYLFQYLDEEVEPLSSENVLVFSAGLLTGSDIYSSSRLHIGSVSPLTGILGSSNVGGFFGARLRQNGILSVIVRGRAEVPVYIWIEDGKVEIKDADSLWGMETTETREGIRKQADVDASVGAIGPAGEHQVTMACIMFEDGHAAGRTGMGAIMGSKNLKALGVSSGDRQVGNKLRDSEHLAEFLQQVKDHPDYEEWSNFGDSMAVKWVDDLGAGTVRNYRDVTCKDIESADGRNFKDLPRTSSTCFRCPVHCKAELEVDRGPYEGERFERPCFEPLVALGPKCGNCDALQSIYLHNRCNELGLDSVEVGGLVAFAMDLSDRGVLGEETTQGLDLSWGNVDAMRKLVDMIARKEGWLGGALSEGLERAGKQIGGGAEKYAYHVKGLAMTAMDPRGFKASALGYAVGNRGGDFTSIYARPEYSFNPERAKNTFGTEKAANRLVEEGKPEVVKRSAIVSAILDSLGICKVPLLSMVEDYELSLTAGLASEVLGTDLDPEKLLSIGERIITAERWFNLRMGLTVEDDSLPKKFTTEKIPYGPAEGSVVELKGMLKEYYLLMGWNSKGVPKKERLRNLDLLKLVCT